MAGFAPPDEDDDDTDDEAAERLAAEIRQQQAAGWAVSDSRTACGVCGEPGQFVSRPPTVGPLVLDGYDAHVDDGAVWYHRQEA